MLVLGVLLPPKASGAVAACLLGLLFGIGLLGRDYLRGRAAQARRRSGEAILHYRRFLERLERRPYSLLRSLGFGLYTSDAIALVRNNIGVALLRLGDSKAATKEFEMALARDADYAVPHLNLSIIAVLEGDHRRAEKLRADAHRLGYSNALLDRALRQAMVKVNVAFGSIGSGDASA